jgi:hypothetical protein
MKRDAGCPPGIIFIKFSARIFSGLYIQYTLHDLGTQVSFLFLGLEY